PNEAWWPPPPTRHAPAGCIRGCRCAPRCGGAPMRCSCRWTRPRTTRRPPQSWPYSASSAIVEGMGWGEAFPAVDTDDPEGVARRIQQRVRAVTRLDCTVGIGENKLQAKLATGYGKPAGIFRLTHGSWFDVLGGQPTDALWGIGRKTAAKLGALGIGTVRELADTDPRALAPHFGPTTGPWLVQT